MERKEGYYWVKQSGRWIIAEWLYVGEVASEFAWEFPGNQFPWEDSDFSEINESRIPSPDENIVGLKASVKGLIMSEYDAYLLLKDQFEKPPTVVIDGELTINCFESEEHCANYRKLNPEPIPEPVVSRVVNRNGKTWDEMTEFEKLTAKVTSIKG